MHDKASASKGLILVVEPDELIRGLLERWLIEAGHGVEAHGADPGDLGRTPALVILDIVRPRDATATVRLFKERHGAPVMAISARFRRGLQTSSDAAARLGARALLAKPFTRDELFEAVERALRP